MQAISRTGLGTVLLSAAIAVSPSAHALLVLTGDTLEYSINNDSDLAALGGSAFVVGDELRFTFTDFAVDDINGNPPGFKNLTLEIDVKSTTGLALGTPTLFEQGDYLLQNSGSSGASVSGQFIATNLEGTGSETDTFGTLFNTSTLTSTPWTITESLEDVAAWGSDYIRLIFQNNLVALAIGMEDFAFIQKKFAAISFTPVPIPGAVLLLGSCLVALIALPKQRVPAKQSVALR